MEPFDRLESRVRAYCRSFPAVFRRARGAVLTTEDGREIIDFFAGAGALNYGHNDPELKRALCAYLAEDGPAHGLDLATPAKRDFLESFESRILAPRHLPYRLLFPGPTGTNAVEAAVKLARRATGRRQVVAFTNAFHGMTLGSLALTGNRAKRAAAGVPLENVTRLPYDGYLGEDVDTVAVAERLLGDPGSGLEPPAAIVLETVQGEGGVHVASVAWLRRVSRLARRIGALLIVDDIQMGCGRTGPFFSFEHARLVPDIVCLSKSLSGYGLPMSLVLVRPEHDLLGPGEHNGTFRGNNLAFVTARAALERWWRTDELSRHVRTMGETMQQVLEDLAQELGGRVRGRGMIQAIEFDDRTLAPRVSRAAFERGVLVETSGSRDHVLKLLPPLTISDDTLQRGLSVLSEAARAAASSELVGLTASGGAR